MHLIVTLSGLEIHVTYHCATLFSRALMTSESVGILRTLCVVGLEIYQSTKASGKEF